MLRRGSLNLGQRFGTVNFRNNVLARRRCFEFEGGFKRLKVSGFRRAIVAATVTLDHDCEYLLTKASRHGSTPDVAFAGWLLAKWTDGRPTLTFCAVGSPNVVISDDIEG